MKTDNPKPQPKREDLQVEYQVCQQAADGQSISHWTFSSIFLGLSTAAFGFIIPNLFLEPRSTAFKIFITIVSILIICIIWLVQRLLLRTSERNIIFYDRMREIEDLNGMEIEHRQKDYKGKRGRFYWTSVISILSTFWILVIIFTWI